MARSSGGCAPFAVGHFERRFGPGAVDAQRSTGHTQLQASALLDRLNAWEGSKASNPYWGRFFWQEVSGLEAQGLEPDLRRLLLSHGYIGASTVSPPSGQLREDLVAYKDTGGPRHGAGAAASLAPLPFAELGFDKWENKLAPDLKRAGPEIYRSLRSAGATPVRDWLGQNFEGSRRFTEWTDLWNIATRADFAISRGDNPAQLAVILATDDGLEIDLRRLSAHVYETRTGDRQGAAAMLAVKAPGAHVDIAPTWMVEEASKHSKM